MCAWGPTVIFSEFLLDWSQRAFHTNRYLSTFTWDMEAAADMDADLVADVTVSAITLRDHHLT